MGVQDLKTATRTAASGESDVLRTVARMPVEIAVAVSPAAAAALGDRDAPAHTVMHARYAGVWLATYLQDELFGLAH